MNEVWKMIPNIPTYEASSHGRLRSIGRFEKTISRHGTESIRFRKEKILSQSLSNNGYMLSSIKNKTMLVHRLIAETFIPKKDGLNEVNHLNGKKTDNRIENIEWTTRSGNEIHARNILKKQSWNKNKNYLNLKALATRKTNYIEKCSKTLNYLNENNATLKETASYFNLSARQISDRLKIARQLATM